MKNIRSVFISDTHLGCEYAQIEKLLDFLKDIKSYDIKYLYLVGDIVDGWKLKRKWYWCDTYNMLFRRILGMVKNGTQVYYIHGNHDDFLKMIDFANDFGKIDFLDEVIHRTADGRRFLVMHGDKFDAIVINTKWLALLGDIGYNLLLKINTINNFIIKILKLKKWSLSKVIKSKVKEAANFINRFEVLISDYAKNKNCDGVICGHIHTPCIKNMHGIEYVNTGDWIESCTAVVEYEDGSLQLIEFINE